MESILHHIEHLELSSWLVLYMMLGVLHGQAWHYVQRGAFHHSCLDNMLSSPGLLPGIDLYEGRVFSVSGYGNTQNAFVWGTENLIVTQQPKLHKYTGKSHSLVICYINGVLGLCKVSHDTVRAVDYYQEWTVSPGLNVKNPHKMLFSERIGLLTFPTPSVLNLLKCFRFYWVVGMVQLSSLQCYANYPTGIFHQEFVKHQLWQTSVPSLS